MTNIEIDELISVIDKKDWYLAKKKLLQQKSENDEKQRQELISKYLNNRVHGINKSPLLYSEQDSMICSNGASLYIFKRGFDGTKNYALKKQHDGKQINLEQGFELVKDKTVLVNLHSKVKDKITHLLDIDYFEHIDEDRIKFTVCCINNTIIQFIFSANEIETAKILLDNPKFKMDIKMPILYAENNLGKAYILGHKN